MRFITYIFVLLCSLSFSLSAAEPDLTTPNKTLKVLSANMFARLDKEKAKLDSEPAYIKVIIEEELIPYFDYKYASYSVLGPHLRKTTSAQRSLFVDVFKEYSINAYGHILLNYDQQKITIVDNKNFKTKKIVNIPVRMRDNSGLVTQLNFKLRKNKKTKEWKVFDVIAEGISLLDTKRSEFGPVIQKQGIDKLIKLLQQKNNEVSS